MNPPITSEEGCIAQTLGGINTTGVQIEQTVVALREAGSQIKIVKQDAATLVLRRRAELLRNIDYMETQIGRLAKMARDVRAEVLELTIE